MRIVTFLAIPALFALASCGGSGGGSSSASAEAPADTGPLSFAQYETQSRALVRDLEAISDDPTPEAALPATGEVTYTGFAGFEARDETQLLGAATVTADFSDDRLSGSISEIVDNDARRYDGRLFIRETGFDRAASDREELFVAELRGTLTRDAETVVLRGDLAGGFGGPEAEFVAGSLMDGALITGGVSQPLLDGGFVAAR